MKLLKQFLAGLSLAALVGMFGAGKANAQIWAFYDEEIVNIFFNPLTGSTTVLSDFQFVDFNGDVDRDDGVVNNVPVGFTFDYNNGLFSTVNVCINGWASVGPQPTPVITHDVYYLFRPNQPNNTLAPFWGDHFYRTGSDIANGYRRSTIHYSTVFLPDPNPNTNPNSQLGTFILEWKDLNVNDKANINSIATFQIKIIQNPMANDLSVPDHRATIQFHYGPIGAAGTVKTQGSSVGIEDSVSDILAHSFMNGLFPSNVNNEEDTRLNDDSLTTCWPPATCLPGRVIQFTPEGRGKFDEWGDGDVNLTQLDTTAPREVRTEQNRFVTLADADSLLRATARAYPPLDSVEGRQAFHGDANHDGRYTNPLYPGFFFYRADAYDAAYILMYLAAKLPVLPWPKPLPVPVYKEAGQNEEASISGIYADSKSSYMKNGTTYVPVVLRGEVSGAFSIEMKVKSLNDQALRFIGAASDRGLIYTNAALGNVAFAAAGTFADGDVVAYLQFVAEPNAFADFELSGVKINGELYPGMRSTLSSGVGAQTASGFRLERNAPNPFNMSAASLTTIRFALEKPDVVSLKIFDVLGNEIRSLVSNEMTAPGEHAYQWDGRTSAGALVTAGTYYYTLTTSTEMLTAKLQVIR